MEPQVSSGFLKQLRSRVAALNVDWRFVLRITLAAGLSYGIAQALRLPEPFWAVITAVIVARTNLGGSLRSGADRLVATLVGAGLGLIVAFARPLGVPEWTLLVAVVAPLALLTALRPEYRAGLIAGVIVLHASAVTGAPLSAGLLRVGDIALGAVVAILVSRFVLPTRAASRFADYSARALQHLSNLLALLARPRDTIDRAQIDRVSSYARRAREAATRAAGDAHLERKRGAPAGTAAALLAQDLTRLHADIGVFGRTYHRSLGDVDRKELAGTLGQMAKAFHSTCKAAGQALSDGSPAPSLAALDAALSAGPSATASPAAAIAMHLLHVLREDLAGVLAKIESQRVAAA